MRFIPFLFLIIASFAQAEENLKIFVERCGPLGNANYGVVISGRYVEGNDDWHIFFVEGTAMNVCPEIVLKEIEGKESSGCTDKAKLNYPQCKNVKVFSISKN